jgi:peptidoglycan-associated lipoprotein
MFSRVDTVLVAAILLGVAGCHKQAPPVTDVKPVGTSSSPGRTTGSDGGAVLNGPARADDGSAAAARRRTDAATLTVMIHFDYNDATLRPEDKRILDAKASVLQANPAVRVRIVGNCDERGSDEYNIALGMRRAAAAKDYLAVAGIAASRIDVSSLGREKPLDPASTEGAWAQNRRDEFNVTAGMLQ